MSKLLLLLFSGAKLSKLLLTVGSMLVSIVAYSFIFGWPYAVGFVGLIFVHEMGHFLAARQRGLNVGAPTFIPFVGAWIDLKEQPLNVETEAYVGLAGPWAGTIGALICYLVARNEGSQLLLALSYSGFFLNLFNLIPLSPLDGGRVTAALSPRIWLIGLPMLVALFLYNPSPLLVLVGILAIPNLIKAWNFDASAPENVRYYDIPTSTRAGYGLAYLGLAGFLAIMTHDVHGMLGALRGV